MLQFLFTHIFFCNSLHCINRMCKWQVATGLYLKHHFLDEMFGKGFISVIFVSLFHQLVEILLHVLEDEVEGVVLPDDLLQLDHVVVAQLLEGLDLA